ncbi:MAG TPA: enolase C-terminal domain-like protein, partial [Solirubrobacteraceae bacterium]|nr:enolase C-terminal domain-like protein [Solirubrobacteraceae bacterium]
AVAPPTTPVQEIEVGAYTIPTDAPEADGTLAWDSTTIVVVHVRAADEWGLGYTYADVSTAALIQSKLAGVVRDADAMSPGAAWKAMVGAVRNLGRPGIASMAIAAVDVALWDLKARILGLPLCKLLGAVRDRVAIYGSGGFTAYSLSRLSEQLAGWVERGIPRVKMKVGSNPSSDPERVRVARDAIGPNAQLFVDANGAYSRKQALELAQRFRAEAGVSWLEEPVSSDDLEGLRLLRDRGPAGMPIAAGEYGYDLPYFRRMLEAGAVDVLQADVTRCAGITELLRVDALCHSRSVPLSLHCGPSIHLHPALALEQFVHLEYFHDHTRIEGLLFDGVASPSDGALVADLSRPGLGLELKRSEAERYAA